MECIKYNKTVHRVRRHKGIVSWFISLKHINKSFWWMQDYINLGNAVSGSFM